MIISHGDGGGTKEEGERGRTKEEGERGEERGMDGELDGWRGC